MITVIYECPKCNDRKLLEHNQKGLHPQLWCNCNGFTTMEIDYTSDE